MANYYDPPPRETARRLTPSPSSHMPYCGDHPGRYGSFVPPQLTQAKQPPGPGQAFVVGHRRRINFVAIVVSLFMPWLLFCAIFAVMSFQIHYRQPYFAYGVVVLGFAVVLVNCSFTMDAVQRKAYGDPTRPPTWFAFAFLTTAKAWILAVIFGNMNFSRNMRPFYDVLNLNSYPSVDPSQMGGQQLMDAGRIIFAEEAQLDLSKSMGFKNLDTYCVAPVTFASGNSSAAPLATYDFWAVGINCCSGNQADFHCGEYNNPRAHAGLRLMRDEQRPFFRLAVQQAEATYNIRAVHPLFLYWMQDPIAEVNAYQDEGFRYYLVGMFSFFVLQLFLTACATVAFSKLGLM